MNLFFFLHPAVLSQLRRTRGGSQSVCIFDTDSVGRDDALPPSHAPLPVTSKVSLYYYNIEMDARLRLGDVASNVKTEGTWTHVFVCIHLSIPGGPAKRVRPIRDASNDSQHNRVASKSIHKQTCTTQSGNKKKCCRAGRPSIFLFSSLSRIPLWLQHRSIYPSPGGGITSKSCWASLFYLSGL